MIDPKIKYLFRIRILSILLPLISGAQENPLRIHCQTSFSEYRDQVEQDSSFAMFELRTIAPNIRYDLRYATANNFVGVRMYPASCSVTFLRAPAANALKKVQESLEKEGLGLKIFDAYRPYSVTCQFWDLVRDERYVAHPAKGSGHNRGLAIDLTIVEFETGNELEMGTGFDHFSDTAHHGFKGLSEQMRLNRMKLKSIMEQSGFMAFETEWWHYSWPNNKDYPVMDFSFKQLTRKIK